MKKLNYKKLYLNLIDLTRNTGVEFHDTVLDGPGVTLFGLKVIFIVIDGRRSFKERVFILCHELGHVFYLKNNNFILRKSPGSEAQANKIARHLLSNIDNKLIKQFNAFYHKTTTHK